MSSVTHEFPRSYPSITRLEVPKCWLWQLCLGDNCQAASAILLREPRHGSYELQELFAAVVGSYVRGTGVGGIGNSASFSCTFDRHARCHWFLRNRLPTCAGPLASVHSVQTGLAYCRPSLYSWCRFVPGTLATLCFPLASRLVAARSAPGSCGETVQRCTCHPGLASPGL